MIAASCRGAMILRQPFWRPMSVRERVRDLAGRAIMQLIAKPSRAYEPFTPSAPTALRRSLQPADVLLIEGNQRVSTVIKYMTQSTWSHATLFVGDALASRGKAMTASCWSKSTCRPAASPYR